jgi:hypothetical protein
MLNYRILNLRVSYQVPDRQKINGIEPLGSIREEEYF